MIPASFGKEKPQISEGFVIEELELNGFMRYITKTILKIPEKFTVIVGRTGAGKSTLLDAITFALYRRTSRTDLKGVGVKVEDICKKGGYVKLKFLQGSKEYEVIRGLNNVGKSYLILKSNGKEIPGSISELDNKIEEIIGLDYEGFRSSTFVRQEEMKALGSASGAERMGICQKLFRLEIFDKAQKRADDKLRILEKSADELSGEISQAKRSLELELPEKTKILEHAMVESANQREILSKLEKRVKVKELEYRELVVRHEEYIRSRAKLESLTKELSEIAMKLEDEAESRREYEELKLRVEELKVEAEGYEELVEERTKLERLKSEFEKFSIAFKLRGEEFRKQEDRYKLELARIEKLIQEELARKKSLKTALSQEQAFELLRNEGALKERIARIGKELGWPLPSSIINELTKERVQAHEELVKVSKDVSAINKDSFVLSEIDKRVKELEVERSRKEGEKEKELEQLHKSILEIQAQIETCGFRSEDANKLKELASAITKKLKAREELQRCEKRFQELSELSKLITEWQLRKDNLEKELVALKSKITEMLGYEERYRKAEQELEALRNELSNTEKTLARLEAEAELVRKEIEKLMKRKEEIAVKEKSYKELKEQVEVLTILKDKIFHKRGITMYAINQLLAILTKEVSANLSDMTAQRFSQANLTIYEEGERYGLKIEVLGVDGRWHDAQEFSGGEKTQINAALRFAIAKQLALLPQVGKTYGRMKTLFIDEGDLGSLDTETSRELFVRKLFDLGKFFDKIILITHLTDVAERPEFATKITVAMSPEGVSRIEY
ncbi:MAG: SMC family ATPase [Candidatus Thermoplasmatota archaeon]|nr:SMC family ATPase [Candidatus Thermoplasmatota archaeon]